MFKLDLEKAGEPEMKLSTSTGSSKKQESSWKVSVSAFWLCQSLWFCGSQQTVETRRITHIPEWDAGLDESQAGIKIAQRNINNLGYADDTTLMAEGEKELKSLLMKVKMESKKAGLKCNIQKTKIMASSPITSWQADGEKIGNSKRSYYLGLQNHCRWRLQPWN